MAVLLEGINIPEGNPITINIYRDGTWVNAYTTEDGNAIEVPEPHGDLIGRDALLKKCEFVCTDDDEDIRAVRYSIIENAPTVIPASEDGKT